MVTDNVSFNITSPVPVNDTTLVSPVTFKLLFKLDSPDTVSEFWIVVAPATPRVEPIDTIPVTPRLSLRLTALDTLSVLCSVVAPVTPSVPPIDKLESIPTAPLRLVPPLTVNEPVIPTSVSCRVLWQLSNSLAKSSPIGLSPSSNLPFNSSKFVCSNVITYIIIYDIHSEYIAT